LDCGGTTPLWLHAGLHWAGHRFHRAAKAASCRRSPYWRSAWLDVVNRSGPSQPRVVNRWTGAIAAVLLGWFFYVPIFGGGLTHLSFDLPLLFKARTYIDDIVIVSLDTRSGDQLGQGNECMWDRNIYARLLRKLKEDGSRTVILDLVFDRPARTPGEDLALAEAIRAHGKVVLASNNIPLLATNAAATGVEQVFPDSDNAVRQLYLARRLPGGGEQVTFTWKAAELEGAPIARHPERRFRFSWINYYAPAVPLGETNGAFRTERLNDALNALPGYFSNKIVLVGAPAQIGSVGAGRDTFNSTYRWGAIQVAGVEVHATILANLLRSDWLKGTMPQHALVLAIFGAGIGLLLVRFRPVAASLLALASAVVLFVAACLSSWHLHFWFPWVTMVIVQIPAAWGWSVLFHWLQGKLERQFLEQSLSMYLSPKLVKQFSRNKDISLLKPGAKKQKLTILFSDIAGFTSVSEGMDSDELAAMMNEYFQGAVGNCIHPTDGTVVKYIGDAIFAFWNAPEPQGDHAVRACEAALRFRAMSSAEVRGRKLVTRIGLHTGVANVGNFGSATRVDYTAIGEDVNLASRMEGLNKYLGTTVLMTGAVKDEIGDQFATRYLGRFQLKGFERAVEVHELVGREDRAPTVVEFGRALELFRSRKLDEAEHAFAGILQTNPQDGPAKFYVKHLAELRGHLLPADWNGEVELKEK